MFISLMSVAILQTLAASGGFGVSGSFSNYHYRMVPGETIETPGVNVVFFNNYDIDIEVELSPNGPSGVTFLLEELIVMIPANTSFTVPIGIAVDEEAIPGEYTLGLSARVIPQTVSGIQVVGAAELRTRLSIFGEAGDLRIEAFDVMGNPFTLRLRLFRVDGNTLAPVDESNNGILERRYVPGTYRVFAYYEGVEVGRRDITLADQDKLTEFLIANTVFIDNFTVVPQFSDPNDLSTFSTARMRYTIRNIYQPPTGPLQDIRLGMKVIYLGNDLGTQEESVIPFLPASTFDGSFTYVPPGGWRTGLYEFQLFAYLGEFENLDEEDVILLASSRVRDLDVPSEATDDEEPSLDPDPEPDPEPEPEPEVDEDSNLVLWILIITGGLGLIGGLILFVLFKKEDHPTAPEIAERKLKKAGYKAGSPELETIVEKVYDTMGPGTDFNQTKRGTEEYVKAVETFLKSLNVENL
jgi:hypothetical protein